MVKPERYPGEREDKVLIFLCLLVILLALTSCGAALPLADEAPAESCRQDFCPTAPLHNVDFGAITINGLPSCRCVCNAAEHRAMIFTPWPFTEAELVEERRRWSVFCPAPVVRP